MSRPLANITASPLRMNLSACCTLVRCAPPGAGFAISICMGILSTGFAGVFFAGSASRIHDRSQCIDFFSSRNRGAELIMRDHAPKSPTCAIVLHSPRRKRSSSSCRNLTSLWVAHMCICPILLFRHSRSKSLRLMPSLFAASSILYVGLSICITHPLIDLVIQYFLCQVLSGRVILSHDFASQPVLF